MNTETTYTTAPACYDSFGTTDLGVVGYTDLGTPVRKVETPKRHVRWQRQQYWGGIVYMTADEAEWKRQLSSRAVFAVEGERAA